MYVAQTSEHHGGIEREEEKREENNKEMDEEREKERDEDRSTADDVELCYY